MTSPTITRKASCEIPNGTKWLWDGVVYTFHANADRFFDAALTSPTGLVILETQTRLRKWAKCVEK